MKKSFFFFLVIICSLYSYAQDSTLEILDPIVAAQEKLQEEYDNENLLEESMFADSRTEEQEEKIIEAAVSVKEAEDKLLATLKDDRQKLLNNLEQAETSKQLILALRTNSSTSTATAEYATQVNLDKSYKVLESATYTVTSLGDALTLRGSTYNSAKGRWLITITSNFFGYTNLFNQDFSVSYKAMTGREVGSILRMTKAQRKQYETDIIVFDSLFRQTVPILSLTLSFKIQKWKGASEYRFIPVNCELRRTDTNDLVLSVPAESLSRPTFIIYPQVEIRTISERNSDIDAANKILSQEKIDSEQNLLNSVSQANGDNEEESVTQRGRKGIFITTDTHISNSDVEDFDIRNVKLNAVKANISFGLKSHGFLGGNFGYDYNENGRNTCYNLGLFGGVNMMINKHIRPFAKAEFDYPTDKTLTPEGGIGVDFILGKVMICIGCDIGCRIDINDGIGNAEYMDSSVYNLFYVGLGFTWH